MQFKTPWIGMAKSNFLIFLNGPFWSGGAANEVADWDRIKFVRYMLYTESHKLRLNILGSWME